MLTRAIPFAVVAVAAFALGLYESGAGGRAERALVREYVRDWARGDYAAMYRLLAPVARARTSEAAFRGALLTAAGTATLQRLVPVRIGNRVGAYYRVRIRVQTRVFGTFAETLLLPLDGHGAGARVAFRGTLLFPGLRPGERLSRHAELGARGALLAADGVPLAEGAGRTSPIPDVAGEIVGRLGPIPPEERTHYAAEGYPPAAKVGLDGLERIFERQLAGRIGGTLLAGRRVLAAAAPASGQTVRTTIVPKLEAAAISALAGRYGAMTVLNPRTGAVEALAGVAFSAVQPPGSTMKIITSVAALQAHLVTLETTFPYATSASIEGYELKNADNESCGGTLINAFATSCNSVFAPLGAQVGAQRLVAAAKRFGFDAPSPISGAPESTIPSAQAIGGPLAVGSSAIGQGVVQANTLEMADVGATIADRGRRPIPTLVYGTPPRFVTVTTPAVAREVERMMEAVVSYGTGTAAQIPGVTVAGKTGTAELRNTGAQTNAVQDTDAWFVGYAPVGRPRVVACALFPNAGFGADTAAPAARAVIAAALGIVT